MVRQHPHAPSSRSPVPLPAICCWRGRALQHAILRTGDRTVRTYLDYVHSILHTRVVSQALKQRLKGCWLLATCPWLLISQPNLISTIPRPRVSSLASWHCALSVRAAPDGCVQQFRVERDYIQVTGRAISPRNTGTVRQASSLSGTARRRLRRRRSRVFNAISPSRRAKGAPRQ
jgi:hypothetical protein